MKYSIFIITAFSFVISFASGIMQISGKIKAINGQSIEVNDEKKIYIISKSKLNELQIKSLAKVKIGNEVSLAVPFTAISDIKTK